MKKLVFIFVLFFSFSSIADTFICYNGETRIRLNSDELRNPFFLSERRIFSRERGIVFGSERTLFNYRGIDIIKEINYIEKEKVRIGIFEFNYPYKEKKIRYIIANNERPFTCKKQK